MPWHFRGLNVRAVPAWETRGSHSKTLCPPSIPVPPGHCLQGRPPLPRPPPPGIGLRASAQGAKTSPRACEPCACDRHLRAMKKRGHPWAAREEGLLLARHLGSSRSRGRETSAAFGPDDPEAARSPHSCPAEIDTPPFRGPAPRGRFAAGGASKRQFPMPSQISALAGQDASSGAHRRAGTPG